jgi:drug/metabolite transporter (DMT)-like permease
VVEAFFIGLAIMLRLAAGMGYLIATVKGLVQPSPVSWFFWGVTALIAFAVQVVEQAGAQAIITLVLGISPVVVFAVAMYRQKHARFSWTDKSTAVVAAVGVALWLLTKDPMMALFFSVAADFVSGIPTIIKSIKDPDSERAIPYLLSVLSMVCTLIAIREWTLAAYIFPLYILGINLLFFTLIATRVGVRFSDWRALRRQQLQHEA